MNGSYPTLVPMKSQDRISDSWLPPLLPPSGMCGHCSHYQQPHTESAREKQNHDPPPKGKSRCYAKIILESCRER